MAEPAELEQTIKTQTQEVMVKLYGAYASDTGVLFGIPSSYYDVVLAIVRFAVAETIDAMSDKNGGDNDRESRGPLGDSTEHVVR